MKSFRHYLAALDRLATARTHQIGRKKLYRAILATTFVAGTQLLAAISATANPVPTPAQPSPLLPTRVLLNGSFESPIVTNWVNATQSSTTGSANSAVAGGNIREAYNEPAANPLAAPIIWRSTETGSTRSQYGYSDAIEVWRGTPGSGGQSATSGAGVQYAELNGSGNASLYQDLCVMPNETINWSLLHAARVNSSADPTDIMQVSITDPTLWVGKTPPAAQANAYYSSLGDYSASGIYPGTKKTTGADPITSSTAAADPLTPIVRPFIATKYSQGWLPYKGRWTSTNTSPKLLRFAFGAIQGSDGDNTYGNFIDNVQLSLPALIDFLPPDPSRNVNIYTTTEGNPNTANPPYYYLSLRINGATTAGQVKIALTGLNQNRSFRVGTVKKGTATVTGLSATADGNSIKLNIPAGTYNPNLTSDYIHIPIDFSDTRSDSNDNLLFTLQSVDSSSLTIKSTQCATDRITVETQLRDDDYQKRVELPFRIAAH
jgi:hypothetical protein